MQRGQDLPGSAGLGPGLAGEKISVNKRNVSVIRQIGEGMYPISTTPHNLIMILDQCFTIIEVVNDVGQK